MKDLEDIVTEKYDSFAIMTINDILRCSDRLNGASDDEIYSLAHRYNYLCYKLSSHVGAGNSSIPCYFSSVDAAMTLIPKNGYDQLVDFKLMRLNSGMTIASQFPNHTGNDVEFGYNEADAIIRGACKFILHLMEKRK